MGALTIALTDGFTGDHVEVLVDDQVVFDQKDVSTRPQISLAREITALGSDSGPSTVRIRLPDRNLDSSIRVDASAPAVLVSVHGDQLDLRATDRPRYM